MVWNSLIGFSCGQRAQGPVWDYKRATCHSAFLQAVWQLILCPHPGMVGIFLTELFPQPSPNSFVPKDPCTFRTRCLCLAPSSSRCLRGWLCSSFRPLPKYLHREDARVAVTLCAWVPWSPCLPVLSQRATVSVALYPGSRKKGRNGVCLS